ncbi:MAG: tetratricopeptide repeat protein, partial [Bacteroidota bacterium]
DSLAIEPLTMAVEKGDDNVDTYNILADLQRSYVSADAAIATLSKARDMYPDNADVLARLFNAYVSSGQADEAIALAETEVANNPDDARMRYNFGSLLLQAERYDDAIEQLTRATELEEGYTSAVFNLGAAYQNKAVAVNAEISEMEDELRGEDVSDARTEELEQMVEAKVAERDQLFAESVPFLVQARELAEAAGDDAADICTALGQAYARTNQMDLAEEAYACAEGN